MLKDGQKTDESNRGLSTTLEDEEDEKDDSYQNINYGADIEMHNK